MQRSGLLGEVAFLKNDIAKLVLREKIVATDFVNYCSIESK